MTAPGAGWAGGNYNHGYDYTSASAGLFGNGGELIDPLPDTPVVVQRAPRGVEARFCALLPSALRWC